MNAETKVRFDWRAHLEVHRAADLFPLMSEAELKELAADIEKNGVSTRIVLWPDSSGKKWLLDGRNRLDALALLGLLTIEKGSLALKARPHDHPFEFECAYRHSDPYALALSYNIHRRHLTAEQKRDLIAKLLKAQPETSDRTIGKAVKTDGKTVAKVRDELEQRAEIPHVEKRTDTKSRKQPSSKRRKQHSSKGRSRAVVGLENGQAVNTADLALARDLAQLKAREAGTQPEPETATDTSAEARKAFYAENAVRVTVVPNPEQDPVQVRVITEPAPASAPTDNDLTEDALARSQRGYDEIGMTMIQWLPRMMTVHKTKLLDFLVNHPEMANVKVPRREKASAA
jgi:ParB-like chromosome segregation protein Spo0J